MNKTYYICKYTPIEILEAMGADPVLLEDMVDDFYVYDEKSYSMIGEKTGRVFELGMRIPVRVKKTDKLLRTIDFELYEEEGE